ncbi:hypothetical protein TEU_08775 [Thermococcus eurythermalis]|uniref:Uncharacterized protein n=1 Tax=Thermococcus eurythermalis TaxID=1505907 RepID=A0A097QVC2_9EURY|nr:hypothetical protein [Thermococcus eurythermalis]AIU70417.1 hypothetical protein TEU_08775 [Thermococcus eurythermalis]
MRALKSIPEVNKSELLEYARKEGGLMLVVAGGRPIAALSNGEPVYSPVEVPEVLRDVTLYRIDKWELLDLIHGELELPQTAGTPSEAVPRVVDFSMSLDLPPELMLKVENAVLDFVKKLSRGGRVAVASIRADGRVLQGVTGTNILALSVSAEGYATEDVPLDVIAREMGVIIERAVGFKTRVHVKEANFRVVPRLPLVKFRRKAVDFKGGRIIEVSLHAGKGAGLKIDRAKVEAEVEKLLREAGISQEFVEAAKGDGGHESGETDVGKIEREVLNQFSAVRGISVNWVEVVKAPSGYRVVVGVDRTSKSLSDSKLEETAKGALKRVEEGINALGRGARIEKAYIVIERDIY